ncbi:MAG: carboxypeptidase-like regulatory domain-containing protein, partial [Bacteroidetes bacterium]
MRTRLTFLLLTFAQLLLAAGGIRGYVRDTEGEPLAYATIYVDEAGSGTVTNAEGYYEFRLLPGDYRVIFQHLGYETQVQRISVGESMKEVNIRLAPQTFELNTVEIIDGGENPAYTVMRKAIAKADYHRQQVDYYKAQVYIKGSGRLLGTPGIARKLLEKEGVKADSSMAYTSESVSIIEYERPHTFRERVISVYSQGDDNESSPMAYINGSFYNAEIAQAISPLSPRAFAYYRFELAGFFQDRGYYVNKIKVTPRSRGDNVFEGFIYIVEDLWSIHSLKLTTYKLGIKFDLEQIYAPVQEEVWLPVSHRFVVSGKVFGFGFDYNYLATVSDYEIRVNPELDVDFAVIDEKIDRELAAAARARLAAQDKRSAIETKLESGQELTRKDLRRLMREYEKEEAAEDPEPEVVSNYSYELDSLATKRDSSYWAVIRPVPLSPAEVRGYTVADSLSVAAKEEAEAAEDGVKKSEQGQGKGFQFFDILTGYSHKLGNGQYLHYDGIHNAGFNPVEGYWVVSRLRYTARKGGQRWRLSLRPRYGFAWDRLEWLGSTDYRYGPKDYNSNIRLRTGRYIAQFNEPKPVDEAVNTLYALFGERNFVRLYEKEFLQLRYQKNWFATAKLSLSAEWADRRFLRNTTDHTLFDKAERMYASNEPDILERPGTQPPLGTERAAILRADFM